MPKRLFLVRVALQVQDEDGSVLLDEDEVLVSTHSPRVFYNSVKRMEIGMSRLIGNLIASPDTQEYRRVDEAMEYLVHLASKYLDDERR